MELAATVSEEILPALIIFKERGGSLGARIQWSLIIPSNVREITNGRMTIVEYQHWLVHVYGRLSQHRLLVIDSYKPHLAPTKCHDGERSVQLRYHHNPRRVHFNCPTHGHMHQKLFKEHIRASWRSWMRENRAKTKMRNLKQPSRQDAINWVSRAWAAVKQETL